MPEDTPFIPHCHDIASMRNQDLDFLIIGAGQDIRDLLHERLVPPGNVICVETGQEVATSAGRTKPDLIVLDLDQTEDGLGLCRRLRNTPALFNVPVILLSDDGGREMTLDAFNAGATDLIAKPLDPEVFSARLKAHLQHQIRNRQLQQRLRQMSAQMDTLPDAVIGVDASGQVNFMNARASRMTGMTAVQASGHPVDAVMTLHDDATLKPVENPVWEALQCLVPAAASECRMTTANGLTVEVEARAAPVLDAAGTLAGGVLLLIDVTEFRTQEKQMRHLLHHDALTDLPNRLMFPQYALDAIREVSDRDTRVAMYVLDIDQFKKVNESFGHATGDLILQEIARRLRQICGDGDVLCRQGADEFLLIGSGQTHEAIEAMAREMLLSLSVPLIINGARHDVSASVGVAIYPQDSSNADTLYHHAHSALNQAKRLGGNRLHFYSAEEERLNNARHLMERRLRVALDANLFELFYQAKMDGRRHCIVGAEALLRLRDEEGAIISPGSFIPLAEETGMIVPIGTWVLREAFARAGQWHRDGYAIRVSVNISAVQFQEPDFYDIVREALDQSGAIPSLVELEITEGVLATQTERSSRVLKALKGIGVQISLDDFGTGYSSLSYLKKFPIDVIKIDQSFVRNMLSDPSDATIVEAIVRIAESMKLRLVAEGVESRAHVDALLTCGCVIMQGYFFSRPIPHADMCAFLEQHFKA